MERLLSSAVDLPQEREVSQVAGSRVMPRDDRNAVRNRSVALRSAVRLLVEAGRALWSNKNEAQTCIAEVAALLQAESDLAEMGVGTSPGPTRLQLAPWQAAL